MEALRKFDKDSQTVETDNMLHEMAVEVFARRLVAEETVGGAEADLVAQAARLDEVFVDAN